MALSEAELDLARTLTGRTRFYEARRKVWLMCLAYGALAIFSVFDIFSEKPVRYHRLISPVVFSIVVGIYLYLYRQAKRLYPEDVQLLAKLRDQAGGEFPPQLEFPTDRSWLKWWRRGRERRPILWRMDRFLTGNAGAR